MIYVKKHFWQLSFLLLFLVVWVLLGEWGQYRQEKQDMMTQMMGQSMGSMMTMMHASNITLQDLLQWKAEGLMPNSHRMHSNGYLRWVHELTTNIVFLLTPLSIGGAILLIIVWHI